MVITSSVAAILNPPDAGVLDETSWNINHPKEVEEKGVDATGDAKVRFLRALEHEIVAQCLPVLR